MPNKTHKIPSIHPVVELLENSVYLKIVQKTLLHHEE